MHLQVGVSGYQLPFFSKVHANTFFKYIRIKLVKAIKIFGLRSGVGVTTIDTIFVP